MSNIPKLREEIHKLYGCESSHVVSVPIVETYQGRTVWEGAVEVFELIGHATALRCYAWEHLKDENGEKIFAVLKLPPIASARHAVQATIASDFGKHNQ
jgi:hypothetical protein